MPDKKDKPAVRRPARKEGKEPVRRPSSRAGGGLDTPLTFAARRTLRPSGVDTETFGRWSESFARFMGTAWFIVGMTVFVAAWIGWNTMAPPDLQFDPRRLNYTLLTLILSLQASYAAPLILLAQNRQTDRDRVQAEQDRDRAERALADTEYLAREIAALRIAMGEVATRDFLRSELRALLEDMDAQTTQNQNTHKQQNGTAQSRPARKKEKKDRPPRAAAVNGTAHASTGTPEPPTEPSTEPSTQPPTQPQTGPPAGPAPAPGVNGSTHAVELPTEHG